MQAGKVDIPSNCRVCGANLCDDRALTCGTACRRELRKRVKNYSAALAELVDAACLVASVRDTAPCANYLDAVKALEASAVAYTVRGQQAGKLPRP